MIIKSYEVKKNTPNFYKHNFYLIYGENNGLKKDIKETIKSSIKNENDDIENLSLYENEILDNEENFYNFIYSGSLFGNKKIITVLDATDKIIKKIEDIYNKFSEGVFIIIFSGILEKKSKLRNFFEINNNTVCVPCYSDSEKDLEIIAHYELKKNNITLSREAINILIEKSNSDRSNLRNEIKKIEAYALNKKNLQIEEIQSLINFSGDYKSDILINECLCGNLFQFKKIISELYVSTTNQILLLRILGNKIQRLLNLKEQEKKIKNLENVINVFKPAIFWKEKPLVKKQLSVWNSEDLNKTILEINNTELLCKKNPQTANAIFLEFFSRVCLKASNFS